MFNLESLIDSVKTEQTKHWKVIKHRLCTSFFTENKCFTVASFIWRNIKYCTHVCVQVIKHQLLLTLAALSQSV